jgi:FAD-dependent oxidoreductase domain-containing protein 1
MSRLTNTDITVDSNSYAQTNYQKCIETGEGWFDPWILLRGLKRKCASLGVNIQKGSPIGAVRDYETGNILSVSAMEQHDGKEVQTTYNVDNVINAAGAHCASLMQTLAGSTPLQYPIPVEPRKRCIFFFHCAQDQEEAIVPDIAPLTICPISNVYFRSEGHVQENGEPTGNFLCGVSPSKENDVAIQNQSDLDYADHELWDQVIWPALYHRVPAFGEVKLKSSWAGLYECECTHFAYRLYCIAFENKSLRNYWILQTIQ